MQDESLQSVIKKMAAIRDYVVAVATGNRRGRTCMDRLLSAKPRPCCEHSMR